MKRAVQKYKHRTFWDATNNVSGPFFLQGVRCVSGLVQDGRLLVPNTKLILDFQLLNTLADCWYQTPNSFWTQQLNRGGRLLCYQTPNSFWTFILNQGGRLSVSNYKLVLNHDGGRLLVPNSKLLLDIHIKRKWSNVGTKLIYIFIGV